MAVVRPFTLLLFMIASAWSADPTPRLSVLFLGDQGHHKPAERFAWIKEPLASRGIDVTYTEKLEDLSATTLQKYDALLVYANIPQVSAEQEKALLDYVASGKGFVPVHCASACFGKNPALVELIGGKFKSHKTDTFRAAIINREHPTMMGFGSFETWDETYVHTQHNEANRTVLMERVDGAAREPWTWIRTHAQGRVFYTASGHDARTWQAPGFQDLLARGIAWSAGTIGEASLKELLGAFGKANRAPLVYEERPTVQNYEKRTPAPQYQLPLSAKDSQDYMKTEHGFTATLFAAEPDVVKPIAFTWDHRGRLWVAESVDYPSKYTDLWQGNDRIKICEDTDGDGKADKFTIFADKLNIPTGLVFANGGLIVSQAPQFLFFKDTNGDDVADERSVLMEGWSKGDTHAGPSNLHYGFDNKIYGAVGYSGFKSTAKGIDNSFRSGLFRMSKNAEQVEFISQFSNNTWGLGISETGEIFGSTANGTHHCYIPIPVPYLDGVVGLSDVGELKKASKIDGHYAVDVLTEQNRQVDVFDGFTAAAGHNLYTARSFPLAYWNRAALVCEPTMHVLHQGFLKRDGSGWVEDGDGGNLLASSEQWVAPVHAQVGPDGSVWVADWYNFIIQHNPTPRKEHGGFDAKTGKGGAHENPLRDETHGRIYRVTWQGAKPGRKQIDVNNVDDILSALIDDNLFWRLAAQRLLVERKNTDVVPRLITIAQNQSVDAINLNGGVVQALWTLHGLGVVNENNAPAFAVAIAALRHPSHGVRRNAVQVLPAIPASSQAIVVSGILNDTDSNVTLAALLAVSQLPASIEIGQALFTLSRNQLLMKDRYISNAFKLAGSRHGLGYLQAARTANVSIPITNDVANIGVQQLKNGDFENIQGEIPGNWRANNFQGTATFSVSKTGRKGNGVEITASGEGADAAWITDVTVKPNTRYRLSGWIQTSDIKGAKGALFNIHGTEYKTEAINATRKWREVFVEFETKAETSIQINCLFGGWGKSTGTARFDDVALKELGNGNTAGLMERLIGENMTMNLSITEQVEALTWLAAGDHGVMNVVAGGMANSWSQRDVPETITEAQRAVLVSLVPKVAAVSQESLGAILARWSGKVAKAIKADDGPQLPPAEMKRYQSGQERYMTLCIACHQPNGQGLAGLAPSLVSSEWVQGSAARPVRIILHGLQGPITVNNQPFTSPVVMPPQKDVLDDVAIAEVLTYVRNAWGNKAAPVQAADVTAIREQEKARAAPWTAEELLKIK